MNRRVARRCAGMMAMVLLLGGCGASGGADTPEASAISTPAAESAAETEGSSAAATTENTTEAAAAEETTEAAVTEKETTEAPAETETTEETTTETEETTEAPAEETTETAAETAAAEKAVSLEDIYSQITQQVSLNSPMTVPAEFIANYFGIDVSAAEDYLFVMSEMATSAETIVIVKAGGADKQALTDSLQAVIDQKAAEMENYLPDQYDIVSRSAVQQTGDYVWLVISENADAIRAVIEAGLQ